MRGRRRPRGFEGGFFPREKPRPPPEDGVKVELSKKKGSTWWTERWIGALERLSRDYESRLQRGRTYARAGRASQLVVRPGEVTARVTGTRPSPYVVRIALSALSDVVWGSAISAMAAEARFSAALLAGRMPEGIDDAFAAAGATLFPTPEDDLATDCSCPDWANPCKHVAAVHYVLGAAFDRDPFLLFELRGRPRDALLEALRAARGGTSRKATGKKSPAGMSLRKTAAADYDRAPAPLPRLHLTIEEPPASGALLASLGRPASWSASSSPADLLAPAVRAAAEQARRVALAAPEDAPARKRGRS